MTGGAGHSKITLPSHQEAATCSEEISATRGHLQKSAWNVCSQVIAFCKCFYLFDRLCIAALGVWTEGSWPAWLFCDFNINERVWTHYNKGSYTD